MPVTFGRRTLTLLIIAFAAFLIASTLYDDLRGARLSRETDSVVPVQDQPAESSREGPVVSLHGSMPSAADKGKDDGPDTEEYMRDMLIWERPENRDGHWPPYKDFID